MPPTSLPAPTWDRVCAWCGLLLEKGRRPSDPSAPSPVSHGICSSCLAVFLSGLPGRPKAPPPDEAMPGEPT
jgi:hypothetical protein